MHDDKNLPVAAQAQPQQSENQEALADTQRAIIEAAERRGYERAIAERAQDREDTERLDWLLEAADQYEIDQGHRGWYVRAPDTGIYLAEDCATAREAIDAARAAKEQS